MDKEKEIEEMEDIISCCWNTISAAKKLYNAGYRKVPDGATVLLIGKNNQALDEKTIEYFVKHNEQIRKETAEQDFCTIIKALEERKERVKAFYGVAESAGVDIAIRTVKELAKQFGVEIKE